MSSRKDSTPVSIETVSKLGDRAGMQAAASMSGITMDLNPQGGKNGALRRFVATRKLAGGPLVHKTSKFPPGTFSDTKIR